VSARGAVARTVFAHNRADVVIDSVLTARLRHIITFDRCAGIAH
jgi:hypothetical protein